MTASSIAFPVLIADIGGTNARFQIIENRQAKPLVFKTVQTADFKTIEEAIESVVLRQCDIAPVTALLAAAGPINDEGLDLTNSHWSIVPEKILQVGPLQQLILLNDFEAQALALPWLTGQDMVTIKSCFMAPSCDKDSALDYHGRTKVVLGAGTGLGVGLLVKAGAYWVPVAGEGGHVDLGPRFGPFDDIVQRDREYEIWQYLEKMNNRVSAENILSGPGLLNLYQGICKADHMPLTLATPVAISQAALTHENKQAVEALNLFSKCLGRVAADVALMAMAQGGVYIAGGIAQHILPFLDEGGFRQAFEDKAPHQALMASIPTHIVTHPLPALLGLSAYARQADDYVMDIEYRHWHR